MAGCGLAQHLCNLLQNAIALAVNNIFSQAGWLPDAPPDFWWLALFSSVGLCAAFFVVFSLFLNSARRNLQEALKEALHRAELSDLA